MWTRASGIGMCTASVALVAALAGCRSTAADQDRFRPVETAQGSETGPSGAYYELRSDRGSLGDAKVGWRGFGVGDDDTTAVRISMRLRNDSEVPLSLNRERTELEMKVGQAPEWVVGPPSDIQGESTVPPGEIRRLELIFDLPEGADLDEVRWFELNWSVASGGADEQVTQVSYSTPFVQEGRRRYRPRWSGYYGTYPYYASPYWGYPGYYSPYYYYDYPLY